MMCFNPKLLRSLNLTFFGLGPWAIIHGIAKLANTFISQIRSLMTPFERSFSKLSENPKNFNIGSTEFKLWHLKEDLNRVIICHFSALDHGLFYPWYCQIDKYFYLSNMNFDDTI